MGPFKKIGEIIADIKCSRSIKKFYLKTEKIDNDEEYIALVISDIKLQDDKNSYSIKIKIPKNISMGEIDSVLDWRDLENKLPKLEILEIKKKSKEYFSNYEVDENTETQEKVINFINEINFSMGSEEDIEPNTIISENFCCEKIYEDNLNIEDKKEDLMCEFFLKINTNEKPNLINNFYEKRKKLLGSQSNELKNELEEEEERIEKEAEEANASTIKIKKIAVILAIVFIIILAVVIVAFATGGPVTGAILYTVIATPIIKFFKFATETIKAIIVAHPLIGTSFLGILFATMRIRKAYKNKNLANHAADMENKKKVFNKTQAKNKNIDEEKKSLVSILELKTTNNNKEHNLVLKGNTLIKMACVYLKLRLQDFKKSNLNDKANKLNITINDADDAEKFFGEILYSNDFNKLKIQNMELCTTKIEREDILDMLDKNITIISMKCTGGFKNTNSSIKIKQKIDENDYNNKINKELIINKYLQKTPNDIQQDDDKLIKNIINDYSNKDLISIFGSIDESVLLLNIRSAAEKKLTKQTDLNNVEIRKDMTYLEELDNVYEEVEAPMHAYSVGEKNVKAFKIALLKLSDIHSKVFKNKSPDNKYRREISLKRLSHITKELNASKNINHAIPDFIAAEDFISILKNNDDPDQSISFLNNFFYCENADQDKRQEIKDCFDRKITFMFNLLKSNVNFSDDQLRNIVKDVFDNEKIVLNVYNDIKKSGKDVQKIEVLFQENSNQDDFYEQMKNKWLVFLGNLNKKNKKKESSAISSFLKQFISLRGDNTNNNEQKIFLNGFNRIKDKNDQKCILSSLIVMSEIDEKAQIKLKESNNNKEVSLKNFGNNVIIEMLLKIIKSNEIIDAFSKTKDGLTLIFDILCLNYDSYDLNEEDLDSQTKTTYCEYSKFIKDFFIDKPKEILSNNPNQTKAINDIKNIFKEIKDELFKQNVKLCNDIEKNFDKPTIPSSPLDSSKLKQEEIK